MGEAFIWGLGASMGGAVGLLFFIIAFWGLEWLCGRTERQVKKMGLDRQALEALVDRNALTAGQIEMIGKVADHLEIMARNSDWYRGRDESR